MFLDYILYNNWQLYELRQYHTISILSYKHRIKNTYTKLLSDAFAFSQ